MKKLVVLAVAAVVALNVFAAGFGIYEASSRGNSMGGALVGDTKPDASSMVYYNAAHSAFATNIMVSAGLTFINPFYDPEVEHSSQNRMNSGWFTAPNFYLVVPLPCDFAFTWGNYTEFGLGSRYAPGWALADDTLKTTMRQVTMNPNLSYKITDKWSISAGPRISWIQFKRYSQPYWGTSLIPGVPYNLHSSLEGEDWGAGWTASTFYKITDDWNVGLVYRSPIRHNIHGHFDLNGNIGPFPYPSEHTHANAQLTLPESITIGSNYNVTDRYRVGASLTYTRWSSLKEIYFNIPGHENTQPFHWRDTPRVGFGMEYDLLSWLTPRIGYVFDRDPSRTSCSTTMLPPGDRHIIASGLGFKITENLTFDVGFSLIRMNNQHYRVKVYQGTANERYAYFSAHNGFSYLVSANISYSF